MKRLTDRYSDGTPFVLNHILQLTNGMSDVIKKLAYYEDLEEQGRLIILDKKEPEHPCNSCNVGWALVSLDGFKSCQDTCKKIKEYNENKE